MYVSCHHQQSHVCFTRCSLQPHMQYHALSHLMPIFHIANSCTIKLATLPNGGLRFLTCTVIYHYKHSQLLMLSASNLPNFWCILPYHHHYSTHIVVLLSYDTTQFSFPIKCFCTDNTIEYKNFEFICLLKTNTIYHRSYPKHPNKIAKLNKNTYIFLKQSMFSLSAPPIQNIFGANHFYSCLHYQLHSFFSYC